MKEKSEVTDWFKCFSFGSMVLMAMSICHSLHHFGLNSSTTGWIFMKVCKHVWSTEDKSHRLWWRPWVFLLCHQVLDIFGFKPWRLVDRSNLVQSFRVPNNFSYLLTLPWVQSSDQSFSFAKTLVDNHQSQLHCSVLISKCKHMLNRDGEHGNIFFS